MKGKSREVGVAGGVSRTPHPADINLFICKWAVEFGRGIRIVFAIFA